MGRGRAGSAADGFRVPGESPLGLEEAVERAVDAAVERLMEKHLEMLVRRVVEELAPRLWLVAANGGVEPQGEDDLTEEERQILRKAAHRHRARD